MVFANFEHFSLSALIFARYLLAAAFKATVEETISLHTYELPAQLQFFCTDHHKIWRGNQCDNILEIFFFYHNENHQYQV